MKRLLLFAVTACTVTITFSQTGIPVPEMKQCDALVQQFLTNYAIPGATFTMAKDGKIVYMRAFGFQSASTNKLTQPYNLFRIASCSKPLTSIAIMLLMQQGKIHMNDTVFGAHGLLAGNADLAAANITDARIYNITVRNLLEHSAGWNRDLSCYPTPTPPYSFHQSGCDPISAPLYVAAQTDGVNPVTKNELIKFLLQKGLDFAPGTQYNYSNIGFLVLGRVIEQITGKSYEEWVKENIFDPLDICDIHLAKNLLVDKQEREVEYVGNGYTTLSSYNTGEYVPWEYGGLNIESMDSHGGWIATARDLVRLLVAVDGFATKPDILTAASIDTMTKASVTNPGYAKGWQVNTANNWWHTGSLDGTATEIVRTSGGYTWAILLNKRDITTNQFYTDLDNLPWNCLASTTTWPTWDLMESPTVNSSAIQFSDIAGGSMKVSWTKGSGDNRLLVVHKDSPVNGFPEDGVDYTANSVAGVGTALNGDNYVLYNDAGSSVTVSNLQVGSTYYFRLFDYNKNTVTGNNSLYLRCNSTEASQEAGSALPVTLGYFTAKAAGSASVALQWQSLNEINTSYYGIERSTDGTHFNSLGKVNAQSGSTNAHTYHFIDQSPLKGTNFYRLKMTDNNGSQTFSKVVSLSFSTTGIHVYPKPARNQLTIEMPEAASVKANVQLIDITGKIVLQQTLSNPVSHLAVSALSPGTYTIKIIAGSSVTVEKFTKL